MKCLRGWVRFEDTEEEGEAERLTRLSVALRRLCWAELAAVAAVVAAAALSLQTQAPHADAWQDLAPVRPEVVGLACCGALTFASGHYGATRRSLRPTRLHFLLSLWLLFHVEALLYGGVEGVEDAANECSPRVGNSGDLSRCDEKQPVGRAVVAAAVALAAVALAAATVALDLDDALTDVSASPLQEQHLSRILRWCDADGDGLVSLTEFVRYHGVVKLLQPERESLLRKNFGRCDPSSSGVLPQDVFRRLYHVTFMGADVSSREHLMAQERAGRAMRALQAVGAMRRPSLQTAPLPDDARWSLAAAAPRRPEPSGSPSPGVSSAASASSPAPEATPPGFAVPGES